MSQKKNPSMAEVKEHRKIQLEALEIQIKRRHIETKRCSQGWSCRRTFCDHNHSYLYSVVNHHQENSLCYICGKIFETRKYMDHHIQTNHSKTSNDVMYKIERGIYEVIEILVH